jgi:hypothetical protein
MPLVRVTSIQDFLLILTASRRKLKAREAFTVPFHFLCDYADQSDQHMSSIARRLEILKEGYGTRGHNQQVPTCWNHSFLQAK